MKIQYLGTAAAEGIPSPFCKCRVCNIARKNKGPEIRTRSQAMINDDLVIDYPCDTNDHMIRFGLDMQDIHHVLLTHSHVDHFYPDDIILRRPDVAKGLENKLHIYGNAANLGRYQSAIRLEKRPYESFDDYQEFHVIRPFQEITVGKYQVTTLRAAHEPSEDSLLFLINDGNKTIFYANDSGMFPENTWEYLKGKHVDLVGFDCTMLKLNKVYNHMNLQDAENARARLMEMGCADDNTIFVLTHFSHNGGMTYEELEKYGKENNFIIAYDGMTIEC